MSESREYQFSVAFGTRVRQLREATPSHLSQETCAHATGLALSSWSRMERGLSVPHASRLPAVARVLGVDMNRLFEGLGENPPS
ncbi:helix-turn-helix domain-containing protein [Brachybacterium alimentarium]|uniref:helix-turn-helix domain-containing protein n=1 Tax=Brachybacterium alimentarium TaxID=47845 RepID=UPI000DF40E34|nr:XRE family transcriptional regulator [Brachybacterium alimentarium]